MHTDNNKCRLVQDPISFYSYETVLIDYYRTIYTLNENHITFPLTCEIKKKKNNKMYKQNTHSKEFQFWLYDDFVKDFLAVPFLFIYVITNSGSKIKSVKC